MFMAYKLFYRVLFGLNCFELKNELYAILLNTVEKENDLKLKQPF